MNVSEKFIGLTKKQAQDKCERMNMIFRLIRIDQENFLDYPEDHRTDRLCCEIEDGKVTKVILQ